MPTIIVSYRRDDTRWITGRIVDRLERDYGKGHVFMDIDAIRPGVDFRDHLQSVLDGCDAVIAIIGPQWFGVDETGRPRLDDPADWVRVEIETALARKIPVIPVLIDRTRMPKVNELPESMREFAYRQAADLDTGKDFHRHMDHLVESITEGVSRRPKPPAPAQSPAADASPQAVAEALVAPAVAKPSTPRALATRKAAGKPGLLARASSRRTKIGFAVFLTLAAILGALAVLGPEALYRHFFASSPMPASTPAQPQVQPQNQANLSTKNTERIGAAGGERAVLYEEEPGNSNGKSYAGSVIWRSETISPGPGQEPDLAIRADIEIPERQLSLTWSLRRNTDASLPASHTIEITFKVPSNFSAGGIANVPGTLMKTSEQTRGVALKGLAVKVTNGFFLFGLSNEAADKKTNIEQLRDKGWLDIPVVYTNDKRAIIAVEKGAPGEQVFKQVFAAWDAKK